MLVSRCLLAVAAAVVAALPVPAAQKPALPEGKWLLTTVIPPGESTVCVFNLEIKDDKPAVAVVFTPPNTEAQITDFKVDGQEVSFTVSLTQSFNTPTGAQKFTSAQRFVGVIGDDPKTILGSYGPDARPQRAKLTPTDTDTPERLVRSPAGEAYTDIIQLMNRPLMLRSQAARENDADKKKELLARAAASRQEVDEQLPKAFRELIEQHPQTPAAAFAAMNLLRAAKKFGVTPDEAEKLVKLVLTEAEPYGPRFVRVNTLQFADVIATQTGLGAIAARVMAPLVAELTDTTPAATQVKLLTLYKSALTDAGRQEELTAIDTQLAKLEAKLDAEYLETVPPFQPTKYAGRKNPKANRPVVMELFTGAECPPCVAADVAFDALIKAYAPQDLVLIQYHMHIPGPDPLTNPDSIARWDYYREKFPQGIRGTPSTLFNGKPQAGGGGGMAAAKSKFDEYTRIIDDQLEQSTDLKLAGSARQDADVIAVEVAVNGTLPDGNVSVKLLLVEENIKYVGGNGLRFHHQVVRSLFGQPAGVPLNELKDGKLTAKLDLNSVRADLTKYLEEFHANEAPFPNPARPLDLKGLKVIVLVQDDDSREILTAAQLDVTTGA
jgi:hypothetical protein